MSCLAAVLLAAAAAPLAAQDDRLPRVGVVDLQRILRESVAAQKVRTEIEAQQTQYRSEISAREEELRAQQQELERQRTILSSEAYAVREDEFSKKVGAVQREVAERNQQLEQSLAYGMQQVQVAALRIIAEMADQMQLGLVLDKTQLLLVSKGLEYSDRVLERLNEELKSVPTTPPPDQR
jgi:Skp family chaperone for outer membrane proteins